MVSGVSIAHAKRLATAVPDERVATAKVDERGRLHAEVPLDVAGMRLRPGRGNDVRAVLFEAGSMGECGDPRPIPTPCGGKALALPLSVRPREGQQVARVRVDVGLPGMEGQLVEVAVERVRRHKAPVAIAALAASGVAVALLLNGWGDPTARRGHYEGKTREEIQRDLDEDVAWHSMEISVASRVTMAEGSTSCELRVENVEANHCDQKVKVWESGNPDDVLFESGAIAPGEYLQRVDLAHPLEVGGHTLTVQFQGYERQPTLISNEGAVLGHDTFGASCAAEVLVEVVPAQ